MKGITADGGEGGGKGNLVQGDTVRQEEIRNDRYGVWDVEPGEMLAPIEDAVAQRREGSGESELSDASALERKVADGRKGVGEGQLNQSTSVLSRAGLARVSGRSIFSLLGCGSSPVRLTKAFWPMCVSVAGIVSLVKRRQRRNAKFPIDVRPTGSVNLVIEQPRKKPAGMETRSSGRRK